MSTTRPPAYDQAPGSVEASRRGAHRARAKPALAGLPILAGILIVLLAAGGVWYVLGNNAKDSSSTVQGAVPDDEDTGGGVPASAGSSAGASTAPATQAAATNPATTPAKAGTTTATSGRVDKNIAIRVLNSVPVQGLAKRVATNLQPDGWNVTSTSNSKQKNVVTTKVYYGSAATKATAQALVRDLGFGVIDLEPTVATSGLVVVLGQDSV